MVGLLYLCYCKYFSGCLQFDSVAVADINTTAFFLVVVVRCYLSQVLAAIVDLLVLKRELTLD